MNDLYSWLQDEVNTKNLNDYLYKRDLDKVSNIETEFMKIKAWIERLCETRNDIENSIKQHNISIEFRDGEKLPFIHAQVIEEKGQMLIWINNCWIQKYQYFMEEKEAILLHLAHEIYHVLEKEEKPWYLSYSYKKRHQISEVCAMYYSQKITDLPYHPKLYEIACDLKELKYSKEDIVAALK